MSDQERQESPKTTEFILVRTGQSDQVHPEMARLVEQEGQNLARVIGHETGLREQAYADLHKQVNDMLRDAHQPTCVVVHTLASVLAQHIVGGPEHLPPPDNLEVAIKFASVSIILQGLTETYYRQDREILIKAMVEAQTASKQ